MNYLKIAFGVLVVLSASRFIPHPPNFTPIIAMSLFSGVYFSNKNIAVIVVLLAMFISDAIIGFHSLMIWVYASFVIITFMGSLVKPKIKNLGFATIGSSLFFFLVTNFGVWFSGTFYPKSLAFQHNLNLDILDSWHDELYGEKAY